MKTVVAVVMAGVALALAGAAEAKEWKKVRIGSEGAYPPWNNTDASGRLVGFEIDLAKDLCVRMKVECEFVAQDWDGMIPALQSGKYDAIIAAMSITDERRQVIDFAGPYVFEPTALAAMTGNPLLALKTGAVIDLDAVSPEDRKGIEALQAALKGKTIGAQTSTIQQAFAEKTFPGAEVRAYDKSDSAGLDLTAGRVDAIAMDRSVIEAMAKDASGKGITLFGPTFTYGMLGKGFGVGVRKADGDLKAMFDKAIAEATQDGTITRLGTQWLGYDVAVKK